MPKKRRPHSSLTRRDCERWADAALAEIRRSMRTRTQTFAASGGATAGGAAGVQITITPHTGSLGLTGAAPEVQIVEGLTNACRDGMRRMVVP